MLTVETFFLLISTPQKFFTSSNFFGIFLLQKSTLNNTIKTILKNLCRDYAAMSIIKCKMKQVHDLQSSFISTEVRACQ
jgi:hypothetical protein